jgi:hypothetical protein
MAHPMILSVSWSISASVGTIQAAQQKAGRSHRPAVSHEPERDRQFLQALPCVTVLFLRCATLLFLSPNLLTSCLS